MLDGHTTSAECAACGERFSNDGVFGATGAARISAAFSWHVAKKHSPDGAAQTPAAASRDPQPLVKYVPYALALLVLIFAANFAYRMYLSRQRTSAVRATDQELQKNVRSTLAASDVFEHEKITVGVHDGVVILTGTVHEGWKQLGAGNLAAGVPGVTEVKNLIQVREELDQTKAPWPQASEAPKPPRRQVVPSPEERAQSLVNDGNWQLRHGHRDAAIKDFQAAMALDSHNYEAQSGLQEAEHFQ